MALTADRNTRRREGVLATYKVAASTTIYAGALVCINSSGYAVPAADTSGFKFVGVATEQVDNSSGSDGDKNVVVQRKGTFAFTKDTPAITDIGVSFYVKDDGEVQTAASATNDVLVGVCVDIDTGTGEVWLEIG